MHLFRIARANLQAGPSPRRLSAKCLEAVRLAAARPSGLPFRVSRSGLRRRRKARFRPP